MIAHVITIAARLARRVSRVGSGRIGRESGAWNVVDPFHHGHPIGDPPFAFALLEMIDIAPGRHEVRPFGGGAGEVVVGLAERLIPLQVADVVEDRVLRRHEVQRGAVRPGDEIVGRADEMAVILDRVVPVAGAGESVVQPIQPACVTQQDLMDIVPVDQFGQF